MHGLLTWMRAYRYELVAIADGMIVMMLELVGARMIAPFLGTSIYVWTAIIGVILGALALGNWYGGRLADRGPDPAVLVRVILVAAAVLLAELVMQQQIVHAIASQSLDLRVSAFIIALLIFAPPAALMGVVAPYLAKLRLTDLKHAGQSVGRLYAAGTAGSIIGTFLAGYFLIGAVGSRTLGWWLVIALVLTSFMVQRRGLLKQRLGLIALTVVIAWIVPVLPFRSDYAMIHDSDSSYARYFVLGDRGPDNGMRYLMTDIQGIQSGVDLKHPDEPVFAYTKRFVEAAAVLPDTPQRILMIGGGTFTVPSILHKQYPDATIDVVEIDPALTRLASNHFGYKQSPAIRIINQDGRYFLNQNAAKADGVKYDLVYMDAFSSLSPPFQLTTREAAKRMADNMTDDGLLVVNLVTATAGHTAAFAEASTATYGSVFKNLKWYQADTSRTLEERQNTIVLASQSRARISSMDAQLPWNELRRDNSGKQIILTDDRAPVEQLTANY